VRLSTLALSFICARSHGGVERFLKCVSLSFLSVFSLESSVVSLVSSLFSLFMCTDVRVCGVCLRGRRVWRAVSLSRARKSFSLVFKNDEFQFFKKREKRDKERQTDQETRAKKEQRYTNSSWCVARSGSVRVLYSFFRALYYVYILQH
jgi:hypothetical protein